MVKDWLVYRIVDVMSWPARSPDLNPIETFGITSAKNENRLINTTELLGKIKDDWNNISILDMDKLIRSMYGGGEE